MGLKDFSEEAMKRFDNQLRYANRLRKTWTESERQGRGRRYWFDEKQDAQDFFNLKRKAGYRAVFDGDRPILQEEETYSVWVPFAKKMNSDIEAVEHGIDSLSLNR